MNVPFFDLSEQTSALQDRIMARIRQVCEHGQYALGPFVESFEAEFAAYCGAKYCIGVNTGTSALHLALASLDIGPGDEVITTPMTFVATTWAISYVGATPVFVDINPQTRTLDPQRVEAAITSRTKAILPVHLYGHPADMIPLVQMAEEHGVPVIEDAAQAHGAKYMNRPAGSIGQLGCFSFYPSKNLGALGEGGALVTSDQRLAERARSLRNHAQGTQKNQHDRLGFNYRMDAIQGAVLGEKLKCLEGWNCLRREHAARYMRRIHQTEQFRLPTTMEGCEPVFHLFVVETDERNRIAGELNRSGIGTGLHYPIPVHLQPAYSHLNLPAGSFPHAEALANRCLSLPMFPEMTVDQAEFVCDCVNRAVNPSCAVTAQLQ